MSDWLKNDGQCNCDKCKIEKLSSTLAEANSQINGMYVKLSDFEARLSVQEALQREVIDGLKAIRDALANDGK